ncbi:uncharacterized protein LOC141588010 [Silene latifolia]|uniref:uncharacterized protein LOC141588010 n=1 Tax=Silene latifolia TaxID=37657 RepID=UPI003D786BE8
MTAVEKLVRWIAKKKDHLRIQWVDKVYLKGRMLMDYSPTAASSWSWRKICEWHRSVWNRFNLSKHNFNQWLIQHGRLLTLDRLGNFGSTQQTLCFLCGEKNETHQHLFHECLYAEKCYLSYING